MHTIDTKKWPFRGAIPFAVLLAVCFSAGSGLANPPQTAQQTIDIPLPERPTETAPVPKNDEQAEGKENIEGKESKDGPQTLAKENLKNTVPPVPEANPRREALLKKFPNRQAMGSYNDGWLFQPSKFSNFSRSYKIVSPNKGTAFASRELIETVTKIADQMKKAFPGGEKLLINDVSSEKGGFLRGHVSHQNGLDIDIGYLRHLKPGDYASYWRYFTNGESVHKDFDRTRNWLLMQKFVASKRVARIFVDKLIKWEYCEQHRKGEIRDTKLNREVLRRLRPSRLHRNHLHVRFYCPDSTYFCIEQPEPTKGTGCDLLERNLRPVLDKYANKEEKLGQKSYEALLAKFKENFSKKETGKAEENPVFQVKRYAQVNFLKNLTELELEMRVGDYLCRAKTRFAHMELESIEKNGYRNWCIKQPLPPKVPLPVRNPQRK